MAHTQKCINDLKAAHTEWTHDDIDALLTVLGRGHQMPMTAENLPSDRQLRHASRHIEGALAAVGASGLAATENIEGTPPVSKLVLRDTPPDDNEKKALHAAAAGKREAEEARYRDTPAAMKLARAISNFMQERATSREKIDEMPALGGRGMVSFLTEEANQEAHMAWLQEQLPQFFQAGTMPALQVIAFPSHASEAEQEAFRLETGLHKGQVQITLDTSNLQEADLNASHVRHYAELNLPAERWGDMMTAHHDRNGIEVSPAELARNPRLQTAGYRAERELLEASKGSGGKSLID